MGRNDVTSCGVWSHRSGRGSRCCAAPCHAVPYYRRRAAIKEAIDQYFDGKWVLNPGYKNPEGVLISENGSEDEKDSGEEIFKGYYKVEGDDSDWTDED